MIIATLSRTSTVAPLFNVQPQIYANTPSTYTIADFWKTTFSVPDSSKSSTIDINQIVINYLTAYNEVLSIADLRAQEQSFYWDMTNQILYIHMPIEISPLYDLVQQGRAYGYCDQELVYIDNIEYLPLIKTAQGFERSQDIKGYKKLSFFSGNVNFNNIGGELDFLDTEVINGNDARIYFLDNSNGNAGYTQADLIPIAGAYVEDYSLSLTDCSVKLIDKRKSGDIKIPTETFTTAVYANIYPEYVNKVIPMAYGLIRSSEAYPTNATGNVVFRQAQSLTSIGTVQLLKADVWTTVSTFISQDAGTGTFTIGYAAAREGGASDGTPFKCRVLGSVGYTASTPLDVIEHINNRYLNISFTTSNYNMAEWELARLSLSDVGLLLNKPTELYEVIRQLQDGSIAGYRYDIDNNGLRTAIIDNSAKAETFYIENVDIQDAQDMGYETEGNSLAATLTVQYGRDYYDDNTLTTLNEDNLTYCTETYRMQPAQNYDTLNAIEADAIIRAEAEAAKFKDVRKIVEVTALGEQFLPLRIYDTGTIELSNNFINRDTSTSTGNRSWLGVWKVQILSVSPDISKKTNKIKALLVTKKY